MISSLRVHAMAKQSLSILDCRASLAMTRFIFLKKFISLSPVYKYKISGDSMSPTLRHGQTVLVNRFAYVFARIKIGDVVALYDPRDGKILIKRIIKKQKSRYFVEGDNKNSSTDSRVFGMIGEQAIVGKVWSF